MPNALVTGATGITGHAIVQHLIKDESYKKIYTLSRSQKGSEHSKVHHATLDLQGSEQDMAKSLEHINDIDHVFFCAYLARDSEDEAAKVNGAMLQNFIDALTETGAIKRIKRLILTCGLKQYGVHLGVAHQPMQEDDPLQIGDTWPPNFYYTQQDILRSSSKSAGWDWVVTLPQDVIGFAKGNFMNEMTAVGLYASAAKLAHPNSELPFPGSKVNYQAFNTWTSANLHAKFCLWAAQAPNVGNQIFNVVNGDTESWQNLWPKVAARFGCTVPKEMFPGGVRGTYRDYDSNGWQLKSDPGPPGTIQARGNGLAKDYEGKPSSVYQQIDTVKWAQRPEVTKAWKTLSEKYGLDESAWEKATWGFLTFVLGREYSCVASMGKARKMGWTGYQDTWESMEEAFQDLERAGILPPANKLKEEKSLV